jgi:hypothetical protein
MRPDKQRSCPDRQDGYASEFCDMFWRVLEEIPADAAFLAGALQMCQDNFLQLFTQRYLADNTTDAVITQIARYL